MKIAEWMTDHARMRRLFKSRSFKRVTFGQADHDYIVSVGSLLAGRNRRLIKDHPYRVRASEPSLPLVSVGSLGSMNFPKSYPSS